MAPPFARQRSPSWHQRVDQTPAGDPQNRGPEMDAGKKTAAHSALAAQATVSGGAGLGGAIKEVSRS